MQIKVNKIMLHYQECGDHDAPAIILIRGLGSQLIHWPDSFCVSLSESGFRVIRFDNRDSGLSSKFDNFPDAKTQQTIARLNKGEEAEMPYRLFDMAADVIGLMDVLGIARAHIVGCSMGGMIAQIAAASWAERIISMTSIFSSSGDPALPAGTEEALESLSSEPDDPNNPESIIAHTVHVSEISGSPGYPMPKQELYAQARRAYARSYCPSGVMRQYAAMLADGSRVERLGKIRVPTLVLHGSADSIFPVECGISTAEHIAGAKLRVIDGWGHDFPEALIPSLVSEITAHVSKVSCNEKPCSA